MSQGYAKQERLWIEEQWEYLEEKWPRYDYRVFQIGCCFQKKGDCTKAEAFYDLASKYQSIHLSLNLQSLKNHSNPALRSFYMFFERFEGTMSQQHRL